MTDQRGNPFAVALKVLAKYLKICAYLCLQIPSNNCVSITHPFTFFNIQQHVPKSGIKKHEPK
jgi:hypothetical protein